MIPYSVIFCLAAVVVLQHIAHRRERAKLYEIIERTTSITAEARQTLSSAQENRNNKALAPGHKGAIARWRNRGGR